LLSGRSGTAVVGSFDFIALCGFSPLQAGNNSKDADNSMVHRFFMSALAHGRTAFVVRLRNRRKLRKGDWIIKKNFPTE
jgi:hypothetical protein